MAPSPEGWTVQLGGTLCLRLGAVKTPLRSAAEDLAAAATAPVVVEGSAPVKPNPPSRPVKAGEETPVGIAHEGRDRAALGARSGKHLALALFL